MKARPSLFAVLKISAVGICILMALQGKPPANGQTVQDTEIKELNGHLEHTDVIVADGQKRLRDIELQMAEMQGEERAAFLILGLLTSGSLALQIKVRKRDGA